MSYGYAMEMAGAEILAYDNFGDYQGTWWAKVNYKGTIGWATGSYGSCSGCDSFEGEFGSISHDHGDDYISGCDFDALTPDTCEECAATQKRLIEFGESYLGDLLTWKEAIWLCSRNEDWDMEAKTVIDFIEKNK